VFVCVVILIGGGAAVGFFFVQAGSERSDKTNVEGLSKAARAAMMEEGIAINESLRMLKSVFRILGEANKPLAKGQKAEIVQYRGNMLTELMQDSLGGNAKTLMFVNVGPAASNISESVDSLAYGDLVKNITNEKVSADADLEEQLRFLQVQRQCTKKSNSGSCKQQSARDRGATMSRSGAPMPGTRTGQAAHFSFLFFFCLCSSSALFQFEPTKPNSAPSTLNHDHRSSLNASEASKLCARPAARRTARAREPFGGAAATLPRAPHQYRIPMFETSFSLSCHFSILFFSSCLFA
jgi:hypothetical protein